MKLLEKIFFYILLTVLGRALWFTMMFYDSVIGFSRVIKDLKFIILKNKR